MGLASSAVGVGPRGTVRWAFSAVASHFGGERLAARVALVGQHVPPHRRNHVPTGVHVQCPPRVASSEAHVRLLGVEAHRLVVELWQIQRKVRVAAERGEVPWHAGLLERVAETGSKSCCWAQVLLNLLNQDGAPYG